MQFYSYYLQIRDLKKVQINHCGRLFQEYVVDMYSKISLQRLLFIKYNRKNFYQNYMEIYRILLKIM